MPNIMTIVPEQARGIRKLFFRWVSRQYGGVMPGAFQVLAVDLRVARPAGYVVRVARWSEGMLVRSFGRHIRDHDWLAVFVEVIRGPAPAPLGRADAQ